MFSLLTCFCSSTRIYFLLKKLRMDKTIVGSLKKEQNRKKKVKPFCDVLLLCLLSAFLVLLALNLGWFLSTALLCYQNCRRWIGVCSVRYHLQRKQNRYYQSEEKSELPWEIEDIIHWRTWRPWHSETTLASFFFTKQQSKNGVKRTYCKYCRPT